MTQSRVSTSTPAQSALRRHVYEDALYGETPVLQLPDRTNTATDVARMLVKLGVDGRAPQDAPSSDHDMVARIPQLLALQKAAAGAGFMVTARLTSPTNDRSPIRAVYTQTPGEVAITVADRPPEVPAGRMFNLRWALDPDGLYVPDKSTLTDNEDPSQLYADMLSGILDPSSPTPLDVEYARLEPFDVAPAPTFGTTVVAPRQAS